MTLLLLAPVMALVGLAATVVAAVRAARPLANAERLEDSRRSGSAGADAARRVLDEPDRSTGLARLLLPAGATLWGWSAVVVARSSWSDATPSAARVASVVVLAALAAAVFVLLSEAVPTASAIAAPERVLASCAVPYRVVAALLGPFVVAVDALGAALLLPVGMWLDGGRGPAPSTDELAALVAMDLADVASEGSEGSEGETRRLLAGALRFLEVRVADVMAPRDQLVTVPHTSTVERAEQLVHRSGHSRVLVVGSRGEVTGFLHAKDLIGLPEEKRHGLLPAGLVRVALRVDPQDRLQEVLPRMRRAWRHVAVVESGGVVHGLITLEDVLEAIVGDIRDESDVEGSEPQ